MTSTHGAVRRQDPSSKRLSKPLVTAIDGPAGSGKSSTAKALAKRLRLPYIDTGAMYRAVTLKALRENIPLTNRGRLGKIARKAVIRLAGTDPKKQHVFLDGKDVTKAIRVPELTKNVFYVAQVPAVRREMVKKQRRMGQIGGAVMEGRDIGTKVFPDADSKFYFIASPKVRARRRLRELAAAGHRQNLKDVLRDILRRDRTDLRRKEGPLKRATDAILMDTSSLTIPDTIDRILQIISPKKSG